MSGRKKAGNENKRLYIQYTWKKVGILPPGYPRYEANNDAKWQKSRKIDKINLKSKEKGKIIFWLPSFLYFFPGMIYRLSYIHIGWSDHICRWDRAIHISYQNMYVNYKHTIYAGSLRLT